MKVLIGFLLPKKNDLVGRAITFFGRTPSVTSHCFIVINDDVYEALFFSGITKRDFAIAYENKDYECYELTYDAISDHEKHGVKKFLESYLGSFKGKYGIFKLPAQALDGIISRIIRRPVFCVSNLFPGKMFHYCSSLCGYVLYKFCRHEVEKIFKNWRAYSPDDLRDIVIMNKIFFMKVNSGHRI